MTVDWEEEVDAEAGIRPDLKKGCFLEHTSNCSLVCSILGSHDLNFGFFSAEIVLSPFLIVYINVKPDYPFKRFADKRRNSHLILRILAMDDFYLLRYY